MKNPLRHLSSRDRRLLAIALPVIVLLMLYIVVIRPVQVRHSNANDRLDQALDNIAWLQQRAPMFASQSSCRNPRPTPSNPLAVDHGGIDLSADNPGQGIWRLRIDGGAGDDVLQFLRRLACHGYAVERIELERTADGAGVVGQAQLTEVQP
ncbi:MAG: hypothetical protein CMK32_07265 [Porticoccaceae bacterium]|nr:hypothetical protein [Porticoccaceae bacterium]